VAEKPKPAPKPAAHAAAPAAETPADSGDEDEFLRQRAEQLKAERERRDAAKKKAAAEALRQNQAPDNGQSGEEIDEKSDPSNP
jgi:hypothetical protein